MTAPPSITVVPGGADRFTSLMFRDRLTSHSPSLTADEIRTIVREEIAAADMARSIRDDLPRLTADWRARHGRQP